MGTIRLHHGDILEAMRAMQDNQYDLAIVDPPYGLGKNRLQGRGHLKTRASATLNCDWDDSPPPQEYFDQLMRVSKNQIIWGGNYFPLPPTRCVICWDKMQPWENFSQWEMAWTSFDKVAPMYRFDNRTGGKIHPTQKPVALYRWLLEKYAKPGDKILDTHLGSGSIAIACHDSGFDLDGWELDAEYYQKASARLAKHQQQIKMW